MKRLWSLLFGLVLLTACAGQAAPTATAPPSVAPTAAAVVTATATTTSTSAAPATSPTPSTTARPSTAPTAGATPAAITAATPGGRGTATPARRPANGTTTIPNTSPAAAEALIEQAVGDLLDSYVDPLKSGDLYQTAYGGAVASLRASGKAPQAQAPAFTNDPKQDATLFKTAYLALVGNAGADINQTVLAYEAIRAVAEGINECHTAFLDPEQYRSVTAGLSGTDTYGGIGVTIRTQTRPVTIGSIFPNTPAAKSGLRAGDAIIAVNGTNVAELSADAISPLVRGQAGTTVTLTIRRPGETATRDITMVRADITVPVFTSSVEDGPNGTKVGYMKLYSFSTGAEDQLRDALAAFEQQGVTGWILDLRDNGGGYIDVLSKIAGEFLKGGAPVAYRIERGGGEVAIASDPSRYFTPQRPFAILINGGSASASEALASAAADQGFARLFGQKTAGCLAGASTFRLADGSAMQITIWKIVSPQRRAINQVGQRPDQEIAPDPTGATDPVLDAAEAWLATQGSR